MVSEERTELIRSTVETSTTDVKMIDREAMHLVFLRVSDIANAICLLRYRLSVLVQEHCGSSYSDSRISYTFLYFILYIMDVGELQYCFEELFKWMHGDVVCCVLVHRKCRCDADD